MFTANVVLGIAHIIIMSHLQARKGLAIERVGRSRPLTTKQTRG